MFFLVIVLVDSLAAGDFLVDETDERREIGLHLGEHAGLDEPRNLDDSVRLEFGRVGP